MRKTTTTPYINCTSFQNMIPWRKQLSHFLSVVDSMGENFDVNVVFICTGSGEVVKASTVVLTTGTFLRGIINIGKCELADGLASPLVSVS